MGYFNAVVNSQDYFLENKVELIEMFIYTIVCFFAPFMLGHPQLLVGIVVNMMLVSAALNVKGYKLLPVVIAPALGVFSRGIIFGPFTVFLLYMIPFIWIGNFILVYAFKELNLKRKLNKVLTLVVGAVAKTVFLFGVAFLLVSLNVIPKLFLTTMGLFQLYTALIGGALALGLHFAKKKYLHKA